jgi:RNA polymerase sigma-70 factor (ECF subfamily)
MSNSRDQELIQKCKRGDRRALEELLEQYQRPIYNAAYRMLGNPDDAADVTQATFLKAFEHLDRYDPKYKFFSWIYRIAINESINCFNRGKREQALDELQTDGAPGPEARAQDAVVSRRIQRVLMQLAEDYRVVVVLRHFSECTYREISEILHIPEKTVKSRLYTARQQMKDHLVSAGGPGGLM